MLIWNPPVWPVAAIAVVVDDEATVAGVAAVVMVPVAVPSPLCAAAKRGHTDVNAAMIAIVLLLVPTRSRPYSNSFLSGTTTMSPDFSTMAGADAPSCTAL